MKNQKPSCNVSVFEVLSVVLFSAITVGGAGFAIAQENPSHKLQSHRPPQVAVSHAPTSMQLAFGRAVLHRQDAPAIKGKQS